MSTGTNNAPPPAHRKSSSLNRSWFEGTMEVISGMAPRPVTPSAQLQRPASAPNSPARGIGGGGIERVNSGSGGGWMNISRLPSQDSLDRSIHNESGHGKSTAQIIRDLKHSNSSLSAKMASQEKQYMNQLAEVERNYSKRQQELEDAMRKLKSKMSQYESYKSSAESKILQKDAALSKVKEESAFQRHTISDLKNQLYQLQTELDEAEENVDGQGKQGRPPTHSKGGLIIAPTNSSMSTEDLQQLALDNEELVKEIQELQDQLMQYQGYDKKLQDMQRQLEESQKSQHSALAAARSSPTPMNKERPPRAPSPSSLRDRDLDQDSNNYRQQLQQTQVELESLKQKLSQREIALTKENESLVEEYSRQVSKLEAQLGVFHKEREAREKGITSEVATQNTALETQLKEKNETIVELEEKLDEYAEKLAELAATLAESRQQAQTQEQYRKDEAEDLRMIQDAHESEIARLEKDVDEAQRELELRDEELEEVKQKLSVAQKDLADAAVIAQKPRGDRNEDEKKLEEDLPKGDGTSVSVMNDSYDNKMIQDLEEQLYNSTETVNKLELQLSEIQEERDVAAAAYEREIQALSEKLEVVKGQKRERDTEFTNLKGHWEDKSNSAKEVEGLKREIESMRQRVLQSTEAGKAAEERVQAFESHVRQMETKMEDGTSETQRQLSTGDSEEIIQELEVAKQEVVEAKEEINKLHKQIQDMESSNQKVEELEGHLREAQEALIALDDQMQALKKTNEKLVSEAEKERDEIQATMETQLQSKQAELEKLQSLSTRVEELETERETLLERSNGITPTTTSRSVLGSESVGSTFESESQELREERELLLAKLKDRDTTIASLVRSSMALEQRIETLETEVDESRANYKKAENELQELRSAVDKQKTEDTRLAEEMKYLKGQLKVAKADAKRWKRALQDDGTSVSDYRFQISMLQKANEDYAETVQERDQAIQNLVNQSMTQESHVRDLKTRISSLMKEVELVRLQKGRPEEGALRSEIQRLQEESEIFAGQIIEQDEEFKRMERALRAREEQVISLKREMEELHGGAFSSSRGLFGPLSATSNATRTGDSEQSIVEHQRIIQNLQAELDEMQEAAESNRIELRDLRRQLWEANQAAGSANDLKNELEQAKYNLEQLNRKAHDQDQSHDLDDLNAQLEAVSARNATMEKVIADQPALEAKLADMETQLQERETILQELRSQLSAACERNEQQVSLADEIAIVRTELKEKVATIELLNSEVETLQRKIHEIESDLIQEKDHVATSEKCLVESREQVEELRGSLSVKIESIESLTLDLENSQMLVKNLQSSLDIAQQLREEIELRDKTIDNLEDQLEATCIELKETKGLKLRISSELSDCQARLGALENELTETVSATSSNEELAMKNQNLAQDNASLAQKNQSLLQQIDDLTESHARITEELETMNSDNKILCHELKALGQSNDSLQQENSSLSSNLRSLQDEKYALLQETDDLKKQVSTLSETAVEIESLREVNRSLSVEKEALNQTAECLKNEVGGKARSLEEYTNEKVSLDERVATLNTDIARLNEQKASLADVNDNLRQKIESLSKAHDVVNNENETLSKENESLKSCVDDLKEKNKHLTVRTSEMSQDIDQLKIELESVSNGLANLDELKSKLESASNAREASEESIVETYEKQLAALAAMKEAEIDSLRASLTESRGKSFEDIEEMALQLKAMEEDTNGLREHFELELQAKDQQIFAMEHTLHAQEQIVDSMRAEMDQLQSGMEHATKSRRGEVEEMQQEVMEVEARAMKQEREIVALKMQLEESKLAHKAEAVKLKEALAAAMDSPLNKTLSDLHENDRMLEVRERLEQLKARNMALQEENLKLGGRLERAAIQINAFELEQEHAEEVEGENKKLRHQLREYEQLLTNSTKKSSSSQSPTKAGSPDRETQGKDKKKKKFGLFKRRNIDEAIAEEKEEESI